MVREVRTVAGRGRPCDHFRFDDVTSGLDSWSAFPDQGCQVLLLDVTAVLGVSDFTGLVVLEQVSLKKSEDSILVRF